MVDKFTVRRDMWLRGTGGGQLLVDAHSRDAGKMCCLGFLGLALGVPEGTLEEAGDFSDMRPDDVREFIPSSLATANGYGNSGCKSSPIHDQIVHMNDTDDEDMTDKGREEELFRLFSLVGITVEFVDE